MCTSERCRQGSENSGSKIRQSWKVTFHDLEITNNESPEQEIYKASVKADSEEFNSKSGISKKINVLWQYCDNCLYNCMSEKTHKKHKTSNHKEL